MTTKTKRSHVAGRLEVTRALRQLREKAEELGDYSPIRPTIDLSDGSYLTLTLAPSSDGGELLGCWIIRREWPSRAMVVYPVN